MYKQFCEAVGVSPAEVHEIQQIPFLPIQFFKTHEVITTRFVPETVFESSGTGNTQTSKHIIKSTGLYTKSFTRAFELFYGKPQDWCILALLPSYQERQNSSLIMMAEELIGASKNPLSGFILNEPERLHHALLHNEIMQQPTLLIGVTYALLDFAEQNSLKLSHTIIMETGGMKGRREELIREQVHESLKSHFGVPVIHSEYGMTELLSQAYSAGEGLFKCPPWMKILIRDEDDALHVQSSAAVKTHLTGAINVIDLANIFSCGFIATDDLGRLYNNDTFEVLGRCEAGDVRGCSLLLQDIA